MSLSYRWVMVLLLALGAWAPEHARAASCWQGPTTNLAFGNVGPAGGTTTGSFSVICQKDWSAGVVPTYFRMCLSIPGGSPINTINPRRMSNYGSGQMTYDLFANPSHTQMIVGGLTSPIYTTTLLVSAAGNAQGTSTFNVYGRVYPGQSLPTGNYQSQNYANIRWVTSLSGYPPESACATGSTIAGVYQNVTSTWENSCAIVATNDLSFGGHGNLNVAHDGQTSLSIQCPVSTAWRVSLNVGQHNLAGQRRMANTSNSAFIGYGLYRNTGRTQHWGSNAGVDTVGGTGTGAVQSLPIYGRVPVQTTPPGGDYEDTITVTLTY